MLPDRRYVRFPFVDIYCARYDISLHSGGIPMKLARNIRRVSGTCWKDFQGQRSKVKVVTEPNAMTAEACILTMLVSNLTRLFSRLNYGFFF